MDRRVLYLLLAVIVIVVPLGVGLALGGAFGGSSSPSTSVSSAPTAALILQPEDMTAQAASPLPTELPPDVAAAVPRTPLDEAHGLLDSPDVLFVDARTEGEYTTSHIKGAISMPVDQVEARYTELPTDKRIIFYCA
jgi:hypothetical protein